MTFLCDVPCMEIVCQHLAREDIAHLSSCHSGLRYLTKDNFIRARALTHVRDIRRALCIFRQYIHNEECFLMFLRLKGTKDICSALCTACALNFEKAVEYLLPWYDDIDFSFWEGKTPMEIAIENDNIDITKMLSAKENDIAGIVDHVAAKGQLKTLDFLLQLYTHDHLYREDGFGNTPLHKIVKRGDAQMIHRVYPYILPLNRVLHCAAHGDVVELFIEQYRDEIHEPDTNGDTPLHIAAHYGNEKAASVLLRYQSDMHQKNKKGYKPIHRAILKGHVAVVRMLIKHHEINETDEVEFQTFLHLAAKCGRTEVIKFLLRDPRTRLDIRDRMGDTPLETATRYRKRDVIQTIRTSRG